MSKLTVENRRKCVNEYRVEGEVGFLRIALRRSGEEVCTVRLDAEDVPKAKRLYWTLDTHSGYVRAYGIRSRGKKVSLHQYLYGRRTDHRDQDKLNNCKSNLRPATQSQNQANVGKRKKKRLTSRFKGVGLHRHPHYPAYRGWRARIRVNQKLINLGTYRNEIDAARAYDAAARKHFGTFACLNFPDDTPCPAPSSSSPASCSPRQGTMTGRMPPSAG